MRRVVLITALALCGLGGTALAYPQFQLSKDATCGAATSRPKAAIC